MANRKFKGLIKPGIYGGFQVTAGPFYKGEPYACNERYDVIYLGCNHIGRVRRSYIQRYSGDNEPRVCFTCTRVSQGKRLKAFTKKKREVNIFIEMQWQDAMNIMNICLYTSDGNGNRLLDTERIQPARWA